MLWTQYQVKVYNKTWSTLIDTISPKKIISDIRFSENINWWQWQLQLQLNMNFEQITYSLRDVIKVIEFNDKYKQWRQIYFWYISRIIRTQTSTIETITLTCLWIATLLSSIEFSWIYNQDPADTIKTAINNFNTEYWWNLFTTNNVNNYWSTEYVWLSSWTTTLEAFKIIWDTTNYFRYIDAYGDVTFRLKSAFPDHRLKNQKDIEKISITEDSEWIINYLTTYGVMLPEKIYQDSISIALYWKIETRIDLKDMYNTWSQDSFSNNYISKHKDIKVQTKVSVNTKYDIWSLSPWDTIKVLNSKYVINNLQIIRISYTPDLVSLDLENYISFWDLIISSWK